MKIPRREVACIESFIGNRAALRREIEISRQRLREIEAASRGRPRDWSIVGMKRIMKFELDLLTRVARIEDGKQRIAAMIRELEELTARKTLMRK